MTPGRRIVWTRAASMGMLVLLGGAAFYAMERRRPLQEVERAGAVIVNGDRGEPRWIQLKGARFGDRQLEFVSQIDSLTSVFLEDSLVTAEGLGLLQRLPQLHVLDVSRTPRAEGALRNIGTITQLRELSLGGCGWVASKDLTHLAPLSDLRVLILAGTAIDDSGIDALCGLTGLKTLNLDGCRVSPSALRRLRALPRLKLLSIRGAQMSVAERDSIRAMLPLGEVMHDCESLTDLHRPLPPGVEVEYGNHCAIVGVRLTGEDADLSALEMFDPQSLFALLLIETRIDDAQLAALPDLPNLRRLEIFRGDVTDAGVAGLARFPQLTQVYLRDLPIRGEGLQQLAALTALRDLWIESEILTDDCARHIGGLTSLRRLQVFGPISAESLAWLAQLPTLDGLWIGSPQISEIDLYEAGIASRVRNIRYFPEGRSGMDAEIPRGAAASPGIDVSMESPVRPLPRRGRR